MPTSLRPHASHARDTPAVVDLFVGFFRRDLLAFYPGTAIGPGKPIADPGGGPGFRVLEVEGSPTAVDLFGIRHELTPRPATRFGPRDARMIRAIGAVLSLRYHHLFRMAQASRLELFRGGSDDHYVAAFVEPEAYLPESGRWSRVASTIQTLRTAALSTYENRRVSTGALLLGPDPARLARPTPTDALPYGVELTSLKSVHKLCDGRRTVFLVDADGRLAEIVDVERWAAAEVGALDDTGIHGTGVPCARAYAPHARATRRGGNVCLVLSPNQEIKVFAAGAQAFSFAHGRWRMLDPTGKSADWERAVGRPALARATFQAALDLAESRQGGLFVVLDRPEDAIGRLLGHDDLIAATPPPGPSPEILPGDPLAKRSLHYLARDRTITELDPSVLEALAGLDGAVVSDRSGRLLAFGAILRHDAAMLPGHAAAEGARTTAAIAASHFGPVLKVSEDGVVSHFLDGARVWDL